MTDEQKRHFRAVRLLTAATVLWSLSFPLIKSLEQVQRQIAPGNGSWFHASLTGFARFTAAALVMLVICWPTLRKFTRLEIWEGIGLAFFGGVGILLQMDGLAHTPASTSAFLTQAYCAMVPLIVAARDRARPAGRVLAAVAVMLAGVAILANFNWRTFHLGRGEAETLLSAVFFAGQIIWLERPVFARNDANHFSLVMFVLIGLMSLPIVLATAQTPGDALACYRDGRVLALAGAITLLCTVGAYVMMNQWQRFVPSTEAAVIYGLEPVGASVLALFLPALISRWTGIDYANEQVTWQLAAGGLLILGANLMLQWKWGKSLD